MNLEQINYRVDQMLDRGYSVKEIDGWLIENGIDPVKLYERNKADREYGAGDVARSVAQGLTLNSWDEIEGGLRSIGGGDYKTERDKVRREMANFSEHHPGKAFLGEAGGVLAPAIVSGGATLLGSAPAAARGAGASILRSGIMGAGAGAAEGAGIAPELEDVPLYSAGGAALGGAAGTLLPAAVSGVASGASRLGRAFGGAVRHNPASSAGRRVKSALDADQLTADDVAARMGTLGPESVVGEAGGETTMGLMDIVANRQGADSGRVKGMIENRARTQHGRLLSDLAETTGVGTNFYDDFRRLDRSLRDNAQRDYAIAYARPVEFTGELEDLIRRPDITDAWRTARRSAANQGRHLPEYFTYDDEGLINGVVQYPDMEAWDWIKRGLDARIEKNTDAVTGRVNAAGRDTLNLKDDLLAILDRENPAYQTARQNYSGTAALQGAMEQGRRIFRDDAEISEQIVRRMGDAERQAYIQGATRAIRDKILATGVGDSIARKAVFKSPLYRERMRWAFPAGDAGEAEFRRFMDAIEREEVFQNTRNRLYRGSQTAGRIQGAEDTGLQENMLAMMAGGGPEGLAAAGMLAARKIFGPALGADEANEIMKILGAQDPRVLRDALAAGRTHPFWERIGRVLTSLRGRPGIQGYTAGAGAGAAAGGLLE